jgi:hypothetical protein
LKWRFFQVDNAMQLLFGENIMETFNTSNKPILAITLLGILWATPTLAEETVCRSSLGAVIVDNLRVPQNATCRLAGTRVKGLS